MASLGFKIPKIAVNVVIYGFSVWLSIALIGYGNALKQHEKNRSTLQGVVYSGPIVKRTSWSRGLFGDICIETRHKETWCIKQSFIRKGPGGPGNVYDLLEPGHSVFMKGTGGLIAEITVDNKTNNPKTIIEYGIAGPLILKELQSQGSGTLIMILGLLLTPFIIVLRRVIIPRLSKNRLKIGLGS